MKVIDIILMSATIIFISLLGFFLYGAYCKFDAIEQYIMSLETSLQEQRESKVSAGVVDNATSLTVSTDSPRSWLKMQKTLHNTVVQLIVTVSERNVLQPYKVPQAAQAAGSGFIISPEGEIITNAHVVNQATSIMVQMPAFGKHQFEVDLIGIMPEKDFAIVKFKPEDKEMIEQKLGKMSYLELGDSDKLQRSQEILAMGYPLGQQSLKSTTGVISGRESGMIQMSAPINPGSSGGPSMDETGKVIGINTSGIVAAQNVGYIIPINDVKIFLDDLRAGGLIRKPYIGIYQSKVATEDLVKALGNPEPGGTYVIEVLYDSPLKGQLKPGDMIYKINGIPVDLYGEMTVPWSDDKVTTAEYIARLAVGQKVSIVAYRKGERKVFTCTFDRKQLSPIRQVYPGYEDLPFEAFGGYVVMPLMLNHLPHLIQMAPGLAKYAEDKNQAEPVLIVTHIMPDSPAHRARQGLVGSVLKKVNGKKVKTLDDLRSSLADSGKVITVETTDNVIAALARDKVVKQERSLAQTFGYQVTSGMQKLLEKHNDIPQNHAGAYQKVLFG